MRDIEDMSPPLLKSEDYYQKSNINLYLLAILFANKFEERADIEELLDRNQPLEEALFADVNMSIRAI